MKKKTLLAKKNHSKRKKKRKTNKKTKRKNKGNCFYQFSNDHKHKLKFKNIFFLKNKCHPNKERIIKIKNQN